MAQGEKAGDGGVDDLMGFLEGLVQEWRERAPTGNPMTRESIGREIISLAGQLQRERPPEALPPGIHPGPAATAARRRHVPARAAVGAHGGS